MPIKIRIETHVRHGSQSISERLEERRCFCLFKQIGKCHSGILLSHKAFANQECVKSISTQTIQVFSFRNATLRNA